MKRLWIVIIAALAFLPLLSKAAETAQVRLFCWSLRVFQGSDTFGDTLDLSSIGGPPYNGELFPYSVDTWASGF